MSSPPTPAPATVAAVRRFNRFYTRLVGALDEGHLHSDFSLAEVRVLYEIANGDRPTATSIARDLALDAGYMSRIVRRFTRAKLVERTASPEDARQSILRLTARGRATFRELDARARDDVAALLAKLGDEGQRDLLSSMRRVEGLLRDAGRPRETSYTLRPPRPGDMGWVVHRQAILYHQEFGWNEQYEALTSRIVADFLEHYDPALERCWIAERDGETVGSVFVVKHPERPGVAKLRMLYVEPSARGSGLGRRLVREVTEFAKAAGYHTLTLWTNSVLVSARKIYEAEGYKLVNEEPHTSFGKDLVAQVWELDLGRGTRQ